MHTFDVLEADPRPLVADQLGVEANDPTPDVVAWPVTVRAEHVAEVRTYAGLRVVAAAHRTGPPTLDVAVVARARVMGLAERRGPERVGALTPYTVELLADDVRRAGPSARLEVDVPCASGDAALAAARAQLGALVARGVDVAIRRTRAL